MSRINMNEIIVGDTVTATYRYGNDDVDVQTGKVRGVFNHGVETKHFYWTEDWTFDLIERPEPVDSRQIELGLSLMVSLFGTGGTEERSRSTVEQMVRAGVKFPETDSHG